MSYYTDFREYLDKLEATGRLRRITRTVDKDRELHPLVKWQYRGLAEEDRFGFLFESVTDRDGRPCNGRVASSVIAANREMYALAMGCAVDELQERWSHAPDRLIPPERVATGPVKEEIHKGDAVLEHGGLHEFGIPFATNGWEAFPRVTAASCITRDPESGHLNAGMYNSIVLGAGRANVRTARHLRRPLGEVPGQGRAAAGGYCGGGAAGAVAGGGNQRAPDRVGVRRGRRVSSAKPFRWWSARPRTSLCRPPRRWSSRAPFPPTSWTSTALAARTVAT